MRITGYTYNADNYCSDCIVVALVGPMGVLSNIPVEIALDRVAEARGIDRYDEHTFDSGDFPKVIFSTDDDDTFCGACGNELGA